MQTETARRAASGGPLAPQTVEKLMKLYGFDAIWRADGTVKTPDAFFVGVWSGPDGDLVCLRFCRTKAEAEYYLSPEGNSIEDALNKAIDALKGMIPLGSSR